MKAGILTFHYAHHYGAQLQAYALMKAITGLGVDCEIIDYVRRDTIEGSSLFKRGFSAKALLSNANTLINYGKLKKRHVRFDSFVHDNMRLSKKHYSSYGELKADIPEYEVYVCGSDQIWNPVIYEEKTFDPAFFADFAKSGRRVAYAPSFGISSIPENMRDTLKKYLDKFDRLSAREKQGEDIIREIAGRESVTVLDPTLLLKGDEWAAHAAAPVFRKPYLLCYFITDGRKYGEAVKTLSEKYKLPVISLCGSRRVVPSTRSTVMDAGPREFLGLFANASVVCTDSFHGTVFSVIFEKPFFCFESPQKAEKAVNSRLYNILGKLGLLSHIYSHTMGGKEFGRRIDDDGVPDYTQVGGILEGEREKSYRYLEDALRGK